jgi:hypothetical protein
MIQAITCKPSIASHGVSGYVKSPDGRVLTMGTTSALPVSGFCAKLPSDVPTH